MRIEDLTKGKLKTLTEKELINLRDRAHQVYKKLTHEEGELSTLPVIIKKYFLLIDEMKDRNITLNWTSDLDKVKFRTKMLGINYSQLDEIIIEPGFISATGNFVDNPKNESNANIIIKTGNKKMQKKLGEEIKNQLINDVTNRVKNVELVDIEKGQHVELPVFDLVLKPAQNPSKKILDSELQESYNDVEIEDLFNVPIEAKKRKKQEFTKVDADEGIVGAVVYRASNKEEPWTDAEEEWTDRETLEKAAYDYMCKSQTIFHMHNPMDGKMPAWVIESFITDEDTIKKIDDNETYTIPADSWWLSVKIDRNTEEGEELWKSVKSGELVGFSFGGAGFVEDKSPDED